MRSSRVAATRPTARYTSFQIRTESLSPAEQADAPADARATASTSTAYSIQNVSGSFSSQILRGAILAIVVSLALIVIYITVRFQWRFAVPVLIALLHDIVITLGIYSLTQREMTTSTIAAVLTILGYSIYDTIIIFDRIRENMPLMRRSSFAAIANQSLWETIRRSLATTFITLLPVLSLLIFGGDTLKDFAFALLVGIALGRLLDDLHRDADPDDDHGAGAGVRRPEGRGRAADKLLDVEVAAEIEPVAPEPRPSPATARRLSRRERRRAAAASAPADGNGAAPDGPLPESTEPVEAETARPRCRSSRRLKAATM